IVFSVEVGRGQAQRLRQLLQGLQIGLVDAGFVAVDPGAGHEFVQACLDAERALRNAISLPRFAQPPTEDGKGIILGHEGMRPGSPCAQASGWLARGDTTTNVYGPAVVRQAAARRVLFPGRQGHTGCGRNHPPGSGADAARCPPAAGHPPPHTQVPIMRKRPRGRSGLEIAPLVLGGNVFGWTADEATSFKLLDRFVERGFNAIDTADSYSAWAPGLSGGESETLIGRWLARRGRRDDVVIMTKVGSLQA